MPKTKFIFLNSISFIFSIFIGLFIVEFALKLQSKRETYINSTENYIHLGMAPSNIKKEVVANRIYISQTDSFEESKKYYIQTDETGAIVNPEDKNTFYNNIKTDILFLGGSTTENMFIKENMRFPAIVSTMLNEANFCKSDGCTVINAGASGRDIPSSINVLLNRFLLPRPDKVILMHNINDLIYLLRGNKYWQSNRHIKSISRYPLSQPITYVRILGFILPRTYALITNSITKFFPDNPTHGIDQNKKGISLTGESEKNITNDFIESLDLFINISRTLNIEPILMTQPSRFKDARLEKNIYIYTPGISYKEMGRLHNKFNDIIRGYKMKGITIIDLDSIIKSNKENMYDIVHLTEKGNQLVADIIFNKLTE